MSRAIPDATACRNALARLPELVGLTLASAREKRGRVYRVTEPASA
jgi:hypothetical protein